MKGLCHEALRTSLPTACGEGSSCPHSSPAWRLDSVQLLATEGLAAALPSYYERAWLVGSQARDSACANEESSP